jgi:hypothetical protein
MAIIDNLISYWALDESSAGAGAVTRNDSHASNNLSDTNTTASGTGIISNGADFEASNSEYLSITDASQSGLDVTGDMSISMWLKVESAPSNTEWTLLAKHGGTNATRSYLFRYKDTSGTKALSMRVSSDGTSTNQTESTVNTDLSTATWKHVVMTYTASAGEVRFYVDGSQVGATQTGARTSIYNGTAYFSLGASANGTDNFDGLMDEVGIWDRVLTGAEITSLYNSGAGLAYPFSGGGGGGGSTPLLSMMGIGT